MSLSNASAKREHVMLIGDGFLLTAGAMSIAMALLFGVMAVPGVKGDSWPLAIASNLLLLAGAVGGVLAAWLLNGRAIKLPSAIGAVAGIALGALAIPVVALLSFVLDLVMKPFTSWEFAGPVAMLAVVSAGLLALTVWLLADAVRDLGGARERVRLAIARFAAATAFVVLGAVCVYLIFAQPGPEQGEAVIWAMAGGFVGAGSIAGADLLAALAARRSDAPSAAAGV